MKRATMVDHLSEANTGALITGITGIAGQLIQNRNSGAGSPAANQVANLSEQTLAAVLAAQGVKPSPTQQPPAIPQTNYMIFGAVAVVALLLIFFVIKAKSK